MPLYRCNYHFYINHRFFGSFERVFDAWKQPVFFKMKRIIFKMKMERATAKVED